MSDAAMTAFALSFSKEDFSMTVKKSWTYLSQWVGLEAEEREHVH